MPPEIHTLCGYGVRCPDTGRLKEAETRALVARFHATSAPHPGMLRRLPSLATPPGVLRRALWDGARQVLGSDIVQYPQEVGDCLVAGTMVLGEKIKPIEDVRVGDSVWTAEGNLTTVLSIREILSPKAKVEIKPMGSPPIACTEDHRFLVYRLPKVHGRAVTPHSYERAVAGLTHDDGAATVIARFEGRRPEWVSAKDLIESDYLLAPVRLQAIPRPESPNDLLETEDGRFAAGYFVGRGHAGERSVEWALPLDSPHAERLMAALLAAGLDPRLTHHATGRTCRIRVYSTRLAAWFRSHFYDGTSRSFPGWLIGDEAFLDGLLAADAHRRERLSVLDSKSKSVAHGVMATLVQMGFEPTCKQPHKSKVSNARPMWRVTWTHEKPRSQIWRDERFVCRPVRSICVYQEPTLVYDIGVEDGHHSFLADGVAVHNCCSFGAKHAGEYCQVQAILAGERASMHTLFSPYSWGMGRLAVDCGNNQLGPRDGSTGAWQARACLEYGFLAEDATLEGEALPKYSGAVARTWGNRPGPAPGWVALGQRHVVRAVAPVTTWDELCVAVLAGNPVTIASNCGFTMMAQADGYHHRQGAWGHQMMVDMVDLGDGTIEPHAGINNSWGDLHGPIVDFRTGDKWPAGHLRVRRRDLEEILGFADSFAYTGVEAWVTPDVVAPDLHFFS